MTTTDQWDRNREGYELFRLLWHNEHAQLIEFDNSQRLIGAMVFQEGLETFCGGQVFERQ